MRIRGFIAGAVAVALGSLAAVSVAAPAQAVTYQKVPFGTTLNNDIVAWDYFIGGSDQNEACLSIPGDKTSGMGTAAPQVTAWSCAANSTRQIWRAHWYTTTDFSLWNSATQGCVDDWGGTPANGTAVKLYGPATTCANASQRWSIWTNGEDFYLAPSSTWSGKVVSMSGTTPTNGALVQMWQVGANSDQALGDFVGNGLCCD